MAAANYIEVAGQSTRLNFQIRSFVDQLKQTVDMGNELKASLIKANADGAAVLATKTGLPLDDAVMVYTLISILMTDVNSSANLASVTSRIG